MKKKKGISLIVLIVTIIVIIILAAAVILTLSKNNPIESAREATFKEDVRAFQDELALSISKEYTEKQGQRDEKITETEFDKIKEYIPSFTKKYEGKFIIENDKLIGTDALTEKEVNWSEELNVIASGKAPFNSEDWDKTATTEDGFEWDGTTIIGYKADVLAGTTTLKIPSRCTEIKLEYVYHPDGVRELVSEIQKVEIPETCTKIGKGAFNNFNSLKEVILPNSVTEIGDEAFCSCDELTTINMPSSLISIGDSAFEGCRKLAIDLVFPEGLTSIGNWAFRGCSSLTSIIMPDTVTYSGGYSFDGCSSVTNIRLSSKDIEIGSNFNDCTSLKSITIPEGVTTIYSSFGQGCTNLTSITIPSTVTSIDSSSNFNDNLTSIIVDEKNTVFDSRNNCNAIINTATNELIMGCGSTVIPESVKSIGKNAFNGCENLTDISIPEGVTSIGYASFSGCIGLTKLIIPETVENIEGYAFSGCKGLTNITIPKGVISMGENVFYNCNPNITVNCRAESKPSGWSGNWANNSTVTWGYTGE